MPDNHCCGTCRFGQFKMSAHKTPRPVMGISGKCTVDSNEFFAKLPQSITSMYNFQSLSIILANNVTWPEHGDICPVWEHRDAEAHCAGRVLHGAREYPCRAKYPKLEHDGKWWCRLHHPPTVKARNDERQRLWDQESMERMKANLAAKDRQAELERRSRAYDAVMERYQGSSDVDKDIRGVLRDTK